MLTTWSYTLLDDLDYSDDIVLISHTKEQMQAKTTELDTLSNSVGLRIHPGKSKVLRASTTNEEAIVLERKAYEEVDIKARITKAQNAVNALNNISRTKEISIRPKLRLFNNDFISLYVWMDANPGADMLRLKTLTTLRPYFIHSISSSPIMVNSLT